MKNIFLFFLIVMSLFSCSGETPQQTSEVNAKNPGEVNVYSHRHYDIDKSIYKKFEDETGIKVNVIKAKADELLEKIKSEGENSPADLLVTVDAGRIQRAIEANVLGELDRTKLPSGIKDQYIDKNNKWVALTMRARVLAYSKERVNVEELSTMEALTDAKWKGRLLARSSSNIYNQSLMASLLAHNGHEESVKWAKGMVANMAREPKGNDRDQVKAIYAGEGDVAIVNTYYIGKLLASENEEEVKAGQAVNIFFPNQERGTHINISAAGICKHSPNSENAQTLLNYLLSPEIQAIYSEGNHEYPVVEGVDIDPILKEWGPFKSDDLSFTKLGELNTDAVKAFDEASWK